MLLPFLVATALLFASVLSYGVVMNFLVRVAVGIIRRGPTQPRFWNGTAIMGMVTLVTAAAHLSQVALWAAAFRLCGQFSNFDGAFYFSAQNYTALGYGDLMLSARWRLLGPLEAVNGLLAFGISTGVLFAILSRLIADEVRTELGYRGERTAKHEASLGGR